MAKVLIMTASTGQGHNQVASVLADELEAKGCRAILEDVLGQTNAFFRMTIVDAYNRMAISSSRINSLLYHYSNKAKTYYRLSRFIYRLMKKSVLDSVQKNAPDLIIVTHPLLVGVLGELKHQGHITSPVLSVVTDFDAHRSYVHQQIDAYITACEKTGIILNSMGILRSKIYVNGIPVRRDFSSRTPQYVLVRPFTILLMGGGLGVKAMEKVLSVLLKSPVALRLIVVCGNNYKLKLELEKRYTTEVPGHITLEILGFTRQIPELMDEADMLFSKPGGITTSEAISKNIPMIVPFLIPGVEEENCRILEEAGVIIRIRQLDEIPALIQKFYRDRSVLIDISGKMQLLAQAFSIDHTLAICEELIASNRSGERQFCCQ